MPAPVKSISLFFNKEKTYTIDPHYLHTIKGTVETPGIKSDSSGIYPYLPPVMPYCPFQTYQPPYRRTQSKLVRSL